MKNEPISIEDFYRSWITRLDFVIEGYVYNEEKELNPTRLVFSRFTEILRRFLGHKQHESEKIVIMPGIRGVGKTTLLTQLYAAEKYLKDDEDLSGRLPDIGGRLYLDASRLKLEGISLDAFFKFYERFRNFKFESLEKKLVLLLDEIHYDDNWGLFLKSLFDRTKGHKNLLVIATGSSAIHLKMNPDLARRSAIIELYPLDFTENLLLKTQVYPPRDLSVNALGALFGSNDGARAFKRIQEKSVETSAYFAAWPENSEDDYFRSGGFPFTLHIQNEIRALELIKSVIDGLISKDILSLKRFETQVFSKINELLYLLANSDVISYEKLGQSLRIGDYRTVNALIETLIAGGIVTKIRSYGKAYGRARKTPKFLFLVPTLRAAILDGLIPPALAGKKLEDYFSLLYTKALKNNYAEDILYDSGEGGADFILKLKNKRRIIVEVGFNKEDIGQIMRTQKKVKADYALLFGSRNLELIDDFVVKLPLEYLLIL